MEVDCNQISPEHILCPEIQKLSLLMSERHFLHVSKFLRQAKEARPFPGCYLSLAHQLSPRAMILWLRSSLSPSFIHFFASPTSNFCSSVSPSQAPTMTEQYFNKCTPQGHQNRFFSRKKWEFQKPCSVWSTSPSEMTQCCFLLLSS